MRRMKFPKGLFWGIVMLGQTAFGQPVDHLVISEIRYYQHSGVNEEFVELYNPTSKPVSLSNWKLMYKSKTGTSWKTKVVFSSRHVIRPHGFFLWGGDAVRTLPDTVETEASRIGLGNSGGNIALVDPNGNVVDKVAWAGGDSPEGNGDAGKTIEGGSLERKAHANSTASSMSPGGEDFLVGNGYDTDQNWNDFVVHNRFAETNPQNSQSPPEPEWIEPVGKGRAAVLPCSAKALDTLDFRLVFYPDSLEPICGMRVLLPKYWQWEKKEIFLESPSLQGANISFSEDTISIADFVLSFPDSAVIYFPRLRVSPVAGVDSILIWIAQKEGEFIPIASFPKVEVQPGVIPISLLHRNTSQGEPLAPLGIGASVMISGIVTVGYGVFSSQMFVQDRTGGICLYSETPYPLSTGDSVTVQGIVQHYRGMTEISPDWSTLVIHASGCALPAPKLLTCQEVNQAFHSDGTEPDEGRLIRILYVTYDSETGTISDGTAHAKLFIDTQTGVVVPLGVFHVTGILKQYKLGIDQPPFTGDYEIVPRFQSDIVSLEGPMFVSNPLPTEISHDRVTIEWKTDTLCIGKVLFWKKDALPDSIQELSPATTHRVQLTGLSPGTVYRYVVRIRNSAGERISPEHWFITASHPSSTGKIFAYFIGSVESIPGIEIPAWGNEDLIDRLVERIQSARYSIDMCFMKLDEWDVRDALIEAEQRGVKIRFICDNEYFDRKEIQSLISAGIPVISDQVGLNEGSGRMHNKFAIFDHRDTTSFSDDWVWTGSFNLTYWGNRPPALENVVCIQDQALAEVYTLEFEEMWGSSEDFPNGDASRFGHRKKNNIPHVVFIKGQKIEAYMSPSDGVSQAIRRAIESADNSVYFSMYSFTAHSLAEWLYARKNAIADLVIRAVLDAHQTEEDGSKSEWSFLSQFADVWLDGEPNLLHHKYAIIDAECPESDPIVLTGSYNWSNSAEYENDENLLLIHDATLAGQFLQEFVARYHAAGGQANWTCVKVEKAEKDFSFLVVYPNPFNNTTCIAYSMPEKRNAIQCVIFDLLGRELYRFEPSQKQGMFFWDGRDHAHRLLPSGIYILQICGGGKRLNQKIVILR